MMATVTHALNMPNGGVATGKDEKQAFFNGLDNLEVRPLWTQMKQVNPPVPNPRAVPHVWRYEQLRPQLIRAGELVSEKEAERRVLMLINPKRGAPRSLPSMFLLVDCP